MTKKKKGVSLLLIVLAMLCLLAASFFFGETHSASASNSSSGTNTSDEWKGSQTTGNLIYYTDNDSSGKSKKSLTAFGWQGLGNVDAYALRYDHKDVGVNSRFGWVIHANKNDGLGNDNYTGGIYYTITLSDADKVKANKGDLTVSASSVNWHQTSSGIHARLQLIFYDAAGKQLAETNDSKFLNIFQNTNPVNLSISNYKVPANTVTIRYYISNNNSLAGKPSIGALTCTLTDTKAPEATGNVSLEKTSVADSEKGIVVAGDTIKYGVELNEKVSLVSGGTATMTLNGQSYTSNTAELVTENGKSKVLYTFTVPSQNQNGTIKLSSVSGLAVKDEAGNAYTYSSSSLSSPTLQYYRAMKVSSSLTHLTFAGNGTATYNQNYTATLSAVRGYNLPGSISISVGGKALAQGSDFTYDSRTGAITITGSKITDDIVITAAGVAKQSTVTFYKENGIGGSESATATFDAPMPAIETPTRTGYTFQGYFTDRGGAGTKYYDASGNSANICDFDSAFSLYAHWTANRYTIQFDGNKPANASSEVKGSTAASPRVYDEGEVPLPENGFSLTGWTFKGWVTPKSGGANYDDMQPVENLSADPNGTITLYAVWEANSYTITLNAMGGTNAGTLAATFDDPLPGITVPEKYGYNFTGYFDAPEGGTQYYGSHELNGAAVVPKFTVVDGLTLYAQWSPITYTIRLYNEGNWVRDIPGVVYGELRLPTAEECGLARKNFDFVGWNIYAEQDWKMYSPGTVYATGLTGTQDDIVVLNASWQEKPIHSLFYDANGGYGAPAAIQVHEEDTVTLSEIIPAREDYTFRGWATSAESVYARYQASGEFTMGDGTVTLYAVWEKNPSLTYDANEGQFVHSVAISYPAAGSTVTITELEPVRDGYTFLGWATAKDADRAEYHAKETFSMPERNTILYAVWKQKQFTVSQSVADGYGISGLEEAYSYGETVTFTVTGKEPKVYVNGTRVLVDGAGNYMYKATENISVVVADASSCVLLYSANGGEDAPTDMKFYSNDGEATVSEIEPTRTGYQFVGWAKSKEAAQRSYRAGSARIFSAGDEPLYQGGSSLTFEGEDVILYAVWEANTYTVSYHAAGGDGEMGSSTHSYGTSAALQENAFTKTGFNFVGWALSEGGACVFADGDEVLNLTAANGDEIELYAVWEQIKTLISFAPEGGGGGSANYMVEYGETLPASGIMAPVRDGYTFGGYFTEQEGEGTQLFDANMHPVNYAASAWETNVPVLTLYAYWIPTTETMQDTLDEVQTNLYTATQQLYAALDDSQTDLEGRLSELSARLSDLDAAYQAADTLIRSEFASADSGIQDQIKALRSDLEAAKNALQTAIKAVEDKLDSAVKNLQTSIETNKNAVDRELEALSEAYKAADNVVRSEFAIKDTELQNQINSLTSTLASAQETLNAAIKVVQDNLDAAVENLRSAIASNKTELETELNSLRSAYESANAVINGEIAGLKTQDTALNDRIDALKFAYETADAALQKSIEDLETKLDKAAKDLQSSIDGNKASIEANEADIEGKVAKLDEAYQAAVSALRSELTAADTALEGRIQDKLDALQQTVEGVQAALQDAIRTAQENLDAAKAELQKAIEENKTNIEKNFESLTSAYEQADALLRSQLTDADSALRSDFTAADEALKGELEGKLTALQNAVNETDETLLDAIADVESRLNSAIEDLKGTVESLQSLVDANETDIEAKVSALDTAYQQAVSALRTELTNADTALEGRIGAQLTALQNTVDGTDKALQAAIQQVQDNLNQAVQDLQDSIRTNRDDIEKKIKALDLAYNAADTLINSEIAGLKAQDSALAESIAALDTAYKEADEALWESIRQVEGKHDALEQENENTAFIYMIVNIVLAAGAAGLIVALVVKAIKKKKSRQ